MALFDKFRKMMILEKKRRQKEQDVSSKEALHIDRKQMSVTQSDRQVRVAQLTPREHDLYLLLLEGFTLKESAKHLGVKYSTANTHMTGIYKKLEVNSRADLIINYRNVDGENTPFS